MVLKLGTSPAVLVQAQEKKLYRDYRYLGLAWRPGLKIDSLNTKIRSKYQRLNFVCLFIGVLGAPEFCKCWDIMPDLVLVLDSRYLF